MNNTLTGLTSHLSKRFRLQQNGTDVKTEIIAGLTTFATMAYTLAVIPKIMHEAGLPTGPVLTAMVLMIFLASAAMGLYTNRPFALAPGLGSVAIFSITLVQGQKIPWEVAAGIVFISGLAFIIVTVLGVRDLIVKIIPKSIKISISAGVGLFICLLGFRNAKIIVANASKNSLDFGNLTNPLVILAVIGFVILLILEARKVRGSALIAILLTTLIGIPLGITKIPAAMFCFPAGISEITFKLRILDALDIKYLPYFFAFFIPDFFSSLGTALGVGGKAGFLDEKGNLPEIDKVFHVDSLAATVGSFFSIPILLTYLESASGVEAGGRTGLTAVTTAVLFLLTLFITPIALMIPAAATAPILILVGMSMLMGMRNIDYTDITEYLPAFLCIALTIFTFNVGNGISAALITFVILKIASGRGNELHFGHYPLCFVLLYYFYALAHA